MAIIMMISWGCSFSGKNNAEIAVRDIFAMDTYMQLKVSGDDTETALNEAESLIKELDGIFSVTNENSDVSRINRADGENTEVSGYTAELISYAGEICAETEGALDITIYPVLREWGFTAGEYHIPDEETLSSLLENVDYRKIETDIDSRKVRIPEGSQLDLGAVAKGYTSDKVIEILRKNGIASGIISLGGNVHALGKKSDGSLWSVGIVDPFRPEETMCILSVEDKAVVTSGNYERFFIGVDGKRYCHIIDPSDGKPADNGLVSVTVVGESGALCDALSTALYVMGKDRATAYQKKNGDFDMVLVTEDKEIFYTAGLRNSLENVSKMNCSEIA